MSRARWPGDRLGEVDAQQGEGVDDLEAGGREALGGLGEEGARAHVAERGVRGRERVDPAADLVDRRDDALVGERQLHDAAVERPGPHTDPWSEPGVHRVPSDLHVRRRYRQDRASRSHRSPGRPSARLSVDTR